MPNAPYHLYGALRGGSAIVEALLTRAGLAFETTDLDWKDVYSSSPAMMKANPVGQIPALVLPNGDTMTETAAITLYLSELAPGAGLAPPPGDRLRPAFLRWLLVLVAQIYPTFTYGDAPERWVSGEAAGAELRDKSDARAQHLWRIVEAELAPGPWMLGDRRSALDIFAAVMTRWRPKREWFARECPRLSAVLDAVDETPDLKPVWVRHYS